MKDHVRFIHDAVQAVLHADEDAVVSDALNQLQKQMPKPDRKGRKRGTGAKALQPVKPALTLAEIHQQMLASGLMSQLQDTANDFDDPDDVAVTIKGEPRSETIIRDRR